MELITEGRLRMKFVTVEEMMAIEREADARGLTYEKMMVDKISDAIETQYK